MELTPQIRPLRDANWAAAILGLGKARVYELVRQGILPHVRLGRQVRFEERAIRSFIESGGCGLPEDETAARPKRSRCSPTDS